MSTGRQAARDLAEEAKKRVVLLLICVIGLSYLMSLTSSSVWINLPVATALIIFFRYMSLELDIRKRTASLNRDSQVLRSKKRSVQLQSFPLAKPQKSNWRMKVNSPAVEAAIEQFTRHLISEWVTDLWYSRITPDRDGPEELIEIMNGVLGEISSRARDINLIDLLTRDIINIVCNHLELYRSSQAKIGKQKFINLPTEHRDAELRLILAAEKKLHPALYSVDAEHKVLQRFMNGLISITFKSEDLQCSFFHYAVRELLSCAVIRPVLNLANPRFINERIESLALSYANKAAKKVTPPEEAALVKRNGPPMPSADQLSALQDRSTPGVELVQFRNENTKSAAGQLIRSTNPTYSQNNSDKGSPNLLSNSVVSTSNISLPFKSNLVGTEVQTLPTSDLHLDSSNNDENKMATSSCGGEWAQTLDMISRRKHQTLAPEHFENMWTKGRNYRKRDDLDQVPKQAPHYTSSRNTSTLHHSLMPADNSSQDHRNIVKVQSKTTAMSKHEDQHVVESLHSSTDSNGSNHQSNTLDEERKGQTYHEEIGPDSESSYPTEDDENNNVTGLGSPGTKVWESKRQGNISSSQIRHPLETSDFDIRNKSNKVHGRNPRASRTSSGRKRSRSSSQKVPAWQEIERTSFPLGDGQDILNASKNDSRTDKFGDDPEVDLLGRIYSGADASSSQSSMSASESSSLSKYPDNCVLADSFIKLRCEVSGANIVRSGSGTFAVYSIAVNDANNYSWSIKRRFRHFEELHRRLKEFPEYNLSLPPKHFLSSGLDVSVVQERCKLLDTYLKKLLQIPTISGSIEVWDFLSVDSQTYMFSDSLSIIQTLSVNLHEKPYEKTANVSSSAEDLNDHLSSMGIKSSYTSNEDFIQINKNYIGADGLRLRKGNMQHKIGMNADQCLNNPGTNFETKLQNDVLSASKSDKPKKISLGDESPQKMSQIVENDEDSVIPTEWVPPNLSIPILNLVGVIFQLQDGGWIRRQAFWVAKHLLQLGMGDAFDDWLIEKIQILRKGSVIASTINRVEQILWPDGIFITKHPKRKPPAPVSSPTAQNNGMKENLLTVEQQLEAARRAQLVREIITDKAPASLVSLVGRKEYENCAQDIYFFLQSPVCLRQLAFELLELLLLAAFPELDDVVRQCHEGKTC